MGAKPQKTVAVCPWWSAHKLLPWWQAALGQCPSEASQEGRPETGERRDNFQSSLPVLLYDKLKNWRICPCFDCLIKIRGHQRLLQGWGWSLGLWRDTEQVKLIHSHASAYPCAEQTATSRAFVVSSDLPSALERRLNTSVKQWNGSSYKQVRHKN